MLEILRKQQNSILVKGGLGLLALMFIFFFGSKTLRRSEDIRHNVPAEVNGTPISGLKANFIVESQVENLRQQFKGQVPENFVEMIRQNTVDGLINSELINQEAKRLGLTTSAEELKNYITTNPQFQENGAFNRNFYLEKFRPWYQMTRGSSYENDIRDELATQKLIEAFSHTLSADDELAKKLYQAENTRYKFSVIKIKKTNGNAEVLPKDLEADKTATENLEASQKELANQIYAQWKSGAKMDDLLKGHNLSVKDTPAISPGELKTVFDGQENLENIKALAQLTADKPFADHYFEQGNFYYLVKLNELKSPATEPSDEDLKTFQASYAEKVASSLESAWIRSLKDKAKITYSE